LEELEACDKILRSFAAFGAGFLAARLAIGITRLAFGLDKKSNLRFALLVYNKMGRGRKGVVEQSKMKPKNRQQKQRRCRHVVVEWHKKAC